MTNVNIFTHLNNFVNQVKIIFFLFFVQFITNIIIFSFTVVNFVKRILYFLFAWSKKLLVDSLFHLLFELQNKFVLSEFSYFINIV